MTGRRWMARVVLDEDSRHGPYVRLADVDDGGQVLRDSVTVHEVPQELFDAYAAADVRVRAAYAEISLYVEQPPVAVKPVVGGEQYRVSTRPSSTGWVATGV